MKNTTTVTRERSAAIDNTSLELGKVGAAGICVSSGIIGCWAVACLASAVIASGGPVALMSSLFSAMVG